MKTKTPFKVRVLKAAEKAMRDCSNPGFCVKCQRKVEGVEPDARGYRCEKCGTNTVFGAEELVMML